MRRALALLLVAALAPVSGDEISPDPFQVRLETLSGGLYVVSRPEPERQPVMGNGVFIVNGDHVVAVDGAGSPLFADRAIAALERLTDLPVRTLVITHWHGDHHLGVHRYRERWPELEVVAHRFTREAMLGAPMDYVDDLRDSLPAQIEGLRAMAASGTMPDGSPIPRSLQQDFSDLVFHGDLILQELDSAQVTPPNQVFTDLYVIDDGPRRIEVRHLGRGNTAGDAVVWLPEERVLVAGDTVVAPTPFGTNSYPANWINVLERFRGLQPRFLVPGHGPVMDDPVYLERLIELLSAVADQAGQAVTEERDLASFRAGFDWRGLPAGFHGGDPRLERRFRQWFADPVLVAAWNEAMGRDNEPLERAETPAGATD